MAKPKGVAVTDNPVFRNHVEPGGLDIWRQRWKLPPQAMQELRMVLYSETVVSNPAPQKPRSEGYVQQQIRLQAPYKGIYTWRNNIIVAIDKRGVPVRGGLANDSGPINDEIKSHDLIGCESYVVKPSDVGRTLGIFWSIECKKEGWHFNPKSKHECAQLKWGNLIVSLGGRSTFATHPDDVQPT